MVEKRAAGADPRESQVIFHIKSLKFEPTTGRRRAVQSIYRKDQAVW